MSAFVRIDDLSDVIMSELMKYSEVTREQFEKIARDVAKEGAKRLKTTSPRGRGSKKGHYADGWTVTAQKSGVNEFSFVIHNKKKPGLTHLLENGHQLRSGGRARAFPHIEQVETWCMQEYEKRIEAEL